MNILMWILQVLLALWNIIGGLYMISNYQIIANRWAVDVFPKPFWLMLGVVQILLAVGLVLPGFFKKQRKLISYSAMGLTIISLLGIVLYASYAGFPGMLWGLLPAILSAFVGYKRTIKN